MDYTLSRKETIVVQKLSFPGLFPTSELKGAFKDASISASTARTIKQQISFTYIGDDLQDGDYIRVSVILDNDFDKETVVLGTFRVYYGGKTGRDKSFNGYAVTKLLDDGRFLQPYNVSKGKSQFSYIKSILADVGLKVAYIPPESHTIRTDKSYLPESYSKLDIVNDLLENAGYLTLDTDEYGTCVFREDSVTPSYSAIVFAEGNSSIVLPDSQEEHDWADVANIVLVTCENADGQVMRAYARNDSQTDTTSTVFRGEVVRVESMSDAENLNAVQKKANSLLAEEKAKITAVTIQHAYRPIRLYDPVWVKMEGIDKIETVQNYEISLSTGLITTTRVRRYEE